MSHAPSVSVPPEVQGDHVTVDSTTADETGEIDLRSPSPASPSRASSCAVTLDRAVDMLTTRSVDVGLAFGASSGSVPGANRQISRACRRWADSTRSDAWLLIADLELHSYLKPADGYSMIRMVNDRGVLVLLPRPRRGYRSTRRTTDRMCEILELGGLAAVNVFCAPGQQRAVSARLRRHHVFAGFQLGG